MSLYNSNNFAASQNILIQSIEQSNLAHTVSRADGDKQLIYVNQAFLDETGYTRDDVIGSNCRFLQGEGTDPESIEAIRSALSAKMPIDIELLNYRKNGTPFWNRLRIAPVFDPNGDPVAFIGIQSNVTSVREKSRIEQERQKLEALGRLVTNVSHEIKNALQPLRLIGEMLSDWSDMKPKDITRSIGMLNENIGVAMGITRDILEYSATTHEDRNTLSVRQLADETTRFVKGVVGAEIDLSVDRTKLDASEDFKVQIRVRHLRQILINLINNASHAMGGCGELTLHWALVDVDAMSALDLGIPLGLYCTVGVEDTGCGMDEATMRMAFDPFFSTKPTHDGTGLGLAISSRIAREWGGAISATSSPGQGSYFTVLMPALPP